MKKITSFFREFLKSLNLYSGLLSVFVATIGVWIALILGNRQLINSTNQFSKSLEEQRSLTMAQLDSSSRQFNYSMAQSREELSILRQQIELNKWQFEKSFQLNEKQIDQINIQLQQNRELIDISKDQISDSSKIRRIKIVFLDELLAERNALITIWGNALHLKNTLGCIINMFSKYKIYSDNILAEEKSFDNETYEIHFYGLDSLKMGTYRKEFAMTLPLSNDCYDRRNELLFDRMPVKASKSARIEFDNSLLLQTFDNNEISTLYLAYEMYIQMEETLRNAIDKKELTSILIEIDRHSTTKNEYKSRSIDNSVGIKVLRDLSEEYYKLSDLVELGQRTIEACDILLNKHNYFDR